MFSKDRNVDPQHTNDSSEATSRLESFLQSEPMPSFSDAAERVWHRLELRGFEPLRPKARVLSHERLFSVFGDLGQGIAAAAVIVVVLGATLLLMHATGGFNEASATGAVLENGETYAAAALTVDDIFRLLVEGREAPPVTIQIPHSGRFEMRGTPTLRVGTQSFTETSPASLETENNQD